jgi:hypothetical protein
MFVTTMIVAAVLLACAALLLGAWAEEARGAFPGKNGRIIFHAHRDNQTGLFALWPDGTDERQIVAEGVYANYSPDGKKIVYSVDQGGTGNDPDIFVANAGGAAPQNLTRSEASEHGGAFSPDGSPRSSSPGGTPAATRTCGSWMRMASTNGGSPTTRAATLAPLGLQMARP